LPLWHGNYHPITARIYTDLSYFTADRRLAAMNQIFNFITGYVEPRRTALLAVAPVSLRERLYGSIEREIANAKAGKPAQIWGKLNSLTDSQLIDRLYEASCAGLRCDWSCAAFAVCAPAFRACRKISRSNRSSGGSSNIPVSGPLRAGRLAQSARACLSQRRRHEPQP
jgi:hypothetical protein